MRTNDKHDYSSAIYHITATIETIAREKGITTFNSTQLEALIHQLSHQLSLLSTIQRDWHRLETEAAATATPADEIAALTGGIPETP
jgi:multidrug resistance efflux pump